MTNYIKLDKTNHEVSIPTPAFNAIYQLGHMLIHMFDEGLGMRQVIDYYYVLSRSNISKKDKDDIVRTIRKMGMMRFAKAMMWIEREVLGLSSDCCFVVPDEIRGRLLLKDILEGSNFGHYSNRYNGRAGFF